jgi:type I restriction enzyme M protein
MQEEIFPFIKTLHPDDDASYTRFMKDATFQISAPDKLAKIIEGIDKLDLTERDSKGDLYEYMLSKLASSKINGQFRTPRHIIKMMVEMAAPQPSDIIVDPAMGTAGFLVAAEEFVRENHGDMLLDDEQAQHFNSAMFHGFDTDPTMLRIGTMNMMLHGVENPGIDYKDSLSKNNSDKELYTLCLATNFSGYKYCNRSHQTSGCCCSQYQIRKAC